MRRCLALKHIQHAAVCKSVAVAACLEDLVRHEASHRQTSSVDRPDRHRDLNNKRPQRLGINSLRRQGAATCARLHAAQRRWRRPIRLSEIAMRLAAGVVPSETTLCQGRRAGKEVKDENDGCPVASQLAMPTH